MSTLAVRRRVPLLSHLPRSAGLALALAVLLFAGGYAAGQGTERTLSAERHALERQAQPLPGGIGLVMPEQVLADAGNALLVDVRSREAYDLVHAANAISMPESNMVQMVDTLPTDRTLVLYCTCPDDRTSIRAARTLAGVFHVPNAVVLHGGLDAYAKAGGAITGSDTDSGLAHQGCGCSTNAPAFKLWAGNLAAEREQQQQEQAK